MPLKSLKEELLRLEKQYWKAMQDHDIETAMSLTDYPCIVAGSQGVGSISQQEFRAMMKSAHYKVKKFSIEDAEVRLLSPDVAILAYDIHEELVVDGKPVTLEASDASTWVKRNDRWVCAMHTESVHGDPYGRDRIQ